jgi:hypothetical protein
MKISKKLSDYQNPTRLFKIICRKGGLSYREETTYIWESVVYGSRDKDIFLRLWKSGNDYMYRSNLYGKEMQRGSMPIFCNEWTVQEVLNQFEKDKKAFKMMEEKRKLDKMNKDFK